jgi:hypothetical protein
MFSEHERLSANEAERIGWEMVTVFGGDQLVNAERCQEAYSHLQRMHADMAILDNVAFVDTLNEVSTRIAPLEDESPQHQSDEEHHAAMDTYEYFMELTAALPYLYPERAIDVYTEALSRSTDYFFAKEATALNLAFLVAAEPQKSLGPMALALYDVDLEVSRAARDALDEVLSDNHIFKDAESRDTLLTMGRTFEFETNVN